MGLDDATSNHAKIKQKDFPLYLRYTFRNTVILRMSHAFLNSF